MLKNEIKEVMSSGDKIDLQKILNLTKYCCFRSREAECLDYARWGYAKYLKLPPEERARLSRFLVSFGNALIIEGEYDEADKVLDSYLSIMGEIVDICFLKHVVAYRNGNVVAATVWGTKYLELLKVEPNTQAFNYQITTVFWGMVQKKLRWLQYLLDHCLEV